MAYESALDEALKPLIAQRDELLENLRRIEGAIAALKGQGATEPVTVRELVKNEPIEASSVYDGMTQPEMTHEAIKRHGRPMLARKIYEIWKAHGVEPVGTDGVHKVQTAIKRREAQVGDVVHVGDGKWGLCSWYDAKEIVRFRREGSFHARDTAEHRKRMVAGIQKAKDRGAHYGSPPKITPEQWDLARKLFQEGEASVRAVHKELIKLTPDGVKPMVPQTLYKWRDDFKAGKPYPERWARYLASKESDDTDPEPNVRLVK